MNRMQINRQRFEEAKEVAKHLPAERWLNTGSEYPFRKGMIYLGEASDTRREVGIHTQQHVLTIAGTGMGKGATSIIPNLQRWPHNVLVIDPSGGITQETARFRAIEFGHKIRVFDPARITNLPNSAYCTINPFAGLRPDDPKLFVKLSAIADACILRTDPKHATWDNSACMIIRGLAELILNEHYKAGQPPLTLDAIKNEVSSPYLFDPDPDTGFSVIDRLRHCPCSTNMPRDAATQLMGRLGPDFLETVIRNLSWLEDRRFREALQDGDFALRDLGRVPTTFYLVVPSEELEEHANFLRLFVRMALFELQAKGEDGLQCLFILDEFHSLGRIDAIAKAMGRVRKFGIKLWPILQDWNQLTQLYENEANSFFTQAGIKEVFGVDDPETLELFSKAMGDNTVTDQRFVLPHQLKNIVGQPVGSPVARRKIVLLNSQPDKICIRPTVYFRERRRLA
ncbi:MAG: type IV secretory system conjugative DNA transfer family protein [Pseudomonadota bacterium]